MGSEDETGLAKLAALIDKQRTEASRHISGRPLVLTAEGWREFQPPEKLRISFENAARQYDAMYWNDYRNLAEKDLEMRGEDIFLARMEVYERQETGDYFSSCVWSAGEWKCAARRASGAPAGLSRKTMQI